MKRTLCILLVLVACLVLTSCKDDRYDDLEKRVTALEKGQEGNQPKTVSNTPTVKPGDPTPTLNVESPLPDDITPTEIPYNYRLDGLSSDEIVGEVESLLNNVPKQGQSYEDYISSIKVEPIRYDIYSDIEVSFTSEIWWYNGSVEKPDIITSFRVSGTQKAMDGTIEYQRTNQYYIGQLSVGFIIKDYTKAVDVYNKIIEKEKVLYDKHKSNDYRDNREGTNWYFEVPIKMSEGLYSSITIISMTANEGFYTISVSRKIEKKINRKEVYEKSNSLVSSYNLLCRMYKK